MKVLRMLSVMAYVVGTIGEMYLNWANSMIKIKGVLTWMYVFGTSMYFLVKTNVPSWPHLPAQELREQILIAGLWFVVAFIAIGRVINGSMANYEEAKRKREERVNQKKGWV